MNKKTYCTPAVAVEEGCLMSAPLCASLTKFKEKQFEFRADNIETSIEGDVQWAFTKNDNSSSDDTDWDW